LKFFRALDANSLCVVPGKLVWKIVVDINIINNDGNLYDACMLATLASWMTFKIPFLRKTGNKIMVTENHPSIFLSTLHVPLSVTFALYDNNTKFLVDPNINEEKCVDGFIIISANKFSEICYLHTYGSIKVDKNTVNE
jgi:exosome complex RNA-binding protein Rrp42 (RNase PH superfamily)